MIAVAWAAGAAMPASASAIKGACLSFIAASASTVGDQHLLEWLVLSSAAATRRDQAMLGPRRVAQPRDERDSESTYSLLPRICSQNRRALEQNSLARAIGFCFAGPAISRQATDASHGICIVKGLATPV